MWWHGTQYTFLAILWLFPPLSAHVSQVWESVIKSICQTSPYLHFRGKTRELYSLGLYSQAIQLQEATGSEYQGLLQAHTIHGLQPWSQGPGCQDSITRSHAPPQSRDLALGSWRHGMVQLLEALEAPLGVSLYFKNIS